MYAIITTSSCNLCHSLHVTQISIPMMFDNGFCCLEITKLRCNHCFRYFWCASAEWVVYKFVVAFFSLSRYARAYLLLTMSRSRFYVCCCWFSWLSPNISTLPSHMTIKILKEGKNKSRCFWCAAGADDKFIFIHSTFNLDTISLICLISSYTNVVLITQKNTERRRQTHCSQ